MLRTLSACSERERGTSAVVPGSGAARWRLAASMGRAWGAVGASALLLSVALPMGATECSDALDNDSDGHVDLDDAGCLMDPARDDETGEFVVTSTADALDASPGDGVCETSLAGECTVRAAIMEANALPGAQGMQIPAGVFELTIARSGEPNDVLHGDLDITDDLVLIGAGPEQTDIGGDLSFLSDRVIEVSPEARVEILGVTVRRGNTPEHGRPATYGGGIFNAGSLVLSNTSVSRNRARTWGGGVYSIGDLTLRNSQVDHNFAYYGGGGILALDGTLTAIDSSVNHNGVLRGYFGGAGIENRASATLVRSLVSANRIERYGDGSGILNSGEMSIVNSTVSRNENASGIHNWGTMVLVNSTVSKNGSTFSDSGIAAYGGETLLINSIIAGNYFDNCRGSSPFQSDGHNLSDDTTCFPGTGTDIVAPAQLGPLADHGGPTETHLPLPGSPAIDAGDDAACPETDQRGVPRPQDGDDPPDGMAHCDIGAVEVAPEPGAFLVLAAGGALLLALRRVPSSRSA